MAVYKRGGKYWFDFVFQGKHIQRSTRQSDLKAARQMEAACRTALAKGEFGLVERKPAPVLKDFAQRFIDAIQVRCAEKPRTIAFYAEKLTRLLEFEPLASARLDKIDEALIESYVQYRRKQVAPGTVNRQLATLRRLLRLAQEWQVISRVPRIRMLPGERIRNFVLTHQQEQVYLEKAPQPLKDIALLLLDTGMRISEALNLQWADVRLEPANGSKFGHLLVRAGKSKNARRNLSLTVRVRDMLKRRLDQSTSPWVFASPDGKPYLVTSLDHLHEKLRAALQHPSDFVLHSLRHTMLSRLGEAGADPFSIMRIAGHSSVTVSQRYVHPSPEVLERAFERLETLNERANGCLAEKQRPLLLPTILTTVGEAAPVTY